MLSRVRKFLRDRSPDWLNTEVNKDLLQNLTANINCSPRPNLGAVRPRVPQGHNIGERRKGTLTKTEGLGVRADIQLDSKQISQQPISTTLNSDRQLLTAHCSLMTVKGTPHWRRIKQVFMALDNAPSHYTYNQLIEYVREATGKGCSRKLISKWKKHRRRENRNSRDDRSSNIVSPPTALAVSTNELVLPTQIIQPELSNACQEMGVNSLQLNQAADNLSTDNSLNRPTLLPVKAWSYLAAAGIVVSLVGCEIIPFNNRPSENVAIASVTAPITPLTPIPERRKNRLEPRNIKIELTLSNPTDLKIKPGDKISAGQVLSDRISERNRLQAKKKQLQLSLAKLNLPLTPIPQPRPIPEIRPLPPVSYAEEEAAIKLHKQKLTEANRAIALQKEKIEQLRSLFSTKAEEKRSGGAREKISSNSPLHPCTPAPLHENCSPVTEGNSASKHKLILEHERANLKNLEAARQSAQIQLEVQESKLTTALEQRAYIEYQRQLEQTRRAIAVEQQQQAIQRQESEREQLLAEREYSQAQIETQIQTLDYQIHQLSTVRAPYEGTIKKVKWTGQSDHNLTAVVTLAVNDSRPTIANSTSKSTPDREAKQTTQVQP